MDQPGDNSIAIACTLTSEDLAAQAVRWQRLRAEAQRDFHHTDDGIRLEFASTPATETELRALVAVENDCCAWAIWSVTKRDGRLNLEVRSTGDGVAALHGMFT